MFTLIVNVELPDPVIVAGANEELVRDGSPLKLNATVPVKPLTAPTVIVYEPCDLRATVLEDGFAVREKSGCAATTKLTDVVCVKFPLVAVMVSGYVLNGVEAEVLTAIVEVPDPGTEAGLKLAVAPAGSPLAPNVTVPVKPPNAVTVTA